MIEQVVDYRDATDVEVDHAMRDPNWLAARLCRREDGPRSAGVLRVATAGWSLR